MLPRPVELGLAVLILLLSIIAMVFWIPNDSETGMIDSFRRQTFIGDAFLPMIAAAGIAVCALVQAVLVLVRAKPEERSTGLDWALLGFVAQIAIIIALALSIMMWLGPMLVDFWHAGAAEPLTYRQLRTTFPWHIVGFLVGGFILVLGLIAVIEGELRASRIVIAAGAVIALILIFDVPFDNLLLPPNGDF